jgi:hypothetical protein
MKGVDGTFPTYDIAVEQVRHVIERSPVYRQHSIIIYSVSYPVYAAVLYISIL